MASVLQTIFSLPSFETRYNENAKNHAEVCTVPLPADCVECQMHKVADGLLSGRYSHPAQFSSGTPIMTPLQHPSPTPVFQQGIKPTGFKALIGKGHEEFSTMKQQDSEEFFTHLITVLRRDMQKYKDRSDQGMFLAHSLSIVLSSPMFYLMSRSYNRLFLWHGTTTSMYRLQKSEVQGG